ncbi:MAG: serine/threonine protein kinase [Leptolyngbya sp.]|nr:serine/threonine protein kinase [Candidatus Melainabacteria bacterium]
MEDASKSRLAKRFFFAKGDRASDEYDQYWIRYKPMRVLKKRFQDFSKIPLWLKVAAVATLVCAVLFNGPVATTTMITLTFALFFILRARLLLSPTHIALTEEGLQFHWLHSWISAKSFVLPWSSLSHIGLANPKVWKVTEPQVEFNIVATGMPFAARLPFLLLTPTLASGWLGDRARVILPLNGLASSDDRKRLQFSFQRFLPTYRIDPTVSDELNLAMRVESYTDLWMGALSTSRSRLRHDTLPAGTMLNHSRYEVLEPIGSGGHSVVYSAIHRELSLEAPVCLKEFVLPSYAGIKVRKRVLQNIQKESKILTGLSHPNIVKFLDFFVEDERAYLVLERIQGETLKQMVAAKGAFKEEEAINFALQMCSILIYLHKQQPPVVHRDFTPDNLMMDYGDIIKLIDFNVAQHLEAASTHTVAGKHSYMPPEQFKGETTVQSDIYALGATLHFMLCGCDPEPITTSHPRDINSFVSDEMDVIVAKATATDSSYRYVNCSDLREDLECLRRERYGHL